MKRKCVLIVDDAPEICDLLSARLIREFQVDVITASSGEEAISWLNRQPFRLVISDLLMPNGDGSVVHRFLCVNPHLNTDFILFTGDTQSPLCISLEADCIIIEKPHWSEIIHAIRFLDWLA